MIVEMNFTDAFDWTRVTLVKGFSDISCIQGRRLYMKRSSILRGAGVGSKLPCVYLTLTAVWS